MMLETNCPYERGERYRAAWFALAEAEEEKKVLAEAEAAAAESRYSRPRCGPLPLRSGLEVAGVEERVVTLGSTAPLERP
jgi:hypothetical protein|tara:strand:- start:1548 stop:1787 length:240 start_codon:yes stop_codon:yes gene_type:complete